MFDPIDTFEEALKRYPNAGLQYVGPFIDRLSQEDVDAIQDILDGSDEETEDAVLIEPNGVFPRPLKD